MNPKLPLSLVVLVTLAIAAGCSRGPEPVVTQPGPAVETPSIAAALEAHAWQRVAVEGDANPPTVRFEDGRVSGFGGCNRFVGGYSVEGDRVRIEGVGSTMMACEPAVMEAETAFLAALGGTHRASIEAGRLSLASDATPALVFEAVPSPRLDGVAWEVTGFNNGREAVVGVLPDTTLQINFGDGAIFGHAGCNRFRAGYTLDGDNISIEPPAATRMFCAGDGVMEQEQQFLEALASAATWTIERGTLDMHRADGARALMARAAEE